MKLPFSFFGKKEKPAYFLALLLRDEKVTAVIFEEQSGKIHPIKDHDEYFSEDIETADSEEWLEVLDKAISTAESALPQDVETQKTIFGVKGDWIEENRIKKEYLAKLKKASDALGLVPLGFLIITEAVTHFLSKQEGAPVSAILVEVDRKNLTVSLLKAGRVMETKTESIDGSIAKTTDQILHHFSTEVLPSRVIVLAQNGKEKLIQEFISHPWNKSLPFLHVPKTSALPKSFDAQAVLFGAATQMGFDVLESDITKSSKKPISSTQAEVLKEEAQPEEEADEEKRNENSDVETLSFGFTKEKDILEIDKEEIEKPLVVKREGEEIHQESPQSVTNDASPRNFFAFSSILPIASSLLSRITLFRKILPSLPPSMPDNKFLSGGKKVLLIPVVVITIVGILLLYVFGVSANVVLHIEPKVVEQDQSVTFSTVDTTSISSNRIASEYITVSKEGSTSTPATGTKDVGDKAKGSVTLFSRLSQEKTFTKGTIITSSNNLQFILDENVKVASTSGASDSPHTARVSVTAKDIGKESNLPSGTRFTIPTFDSSEVEAKNDTAFSGGSKKEVTVVSKNDREKLEETLPKNLIDLAKEEMEKQVSDDKAILSVNTNVSLSEKEFDQEVGEEAKTITLKATASYQGIVYAKKDLQEYSRSALASRIPSNFSLSSNGITYEIRDAKSKNKQSVEATIHIRGSLVPKIENQKLASEIAGKPFNQARSILLDIPQTTSIDIVLRPNLPFTPRILPRLSKNITIIISSDE